MARQNLSADKLARIARATGQPVLAGWVHDGPAWRMWEWVATGHRHGWYNRVTGEHGHTIGCPPGSGPLCWELFGAATGVGNGSTSHAG